MSWNAAHAWSAALSRGRIYRLPVAAGSQLAVSTLVVGLLAIFGCTAGTAGAGRASTSSGGSIGSGGSSAAGRGGATGGNYGSGGMSSTSGSGGSAVGSSAQLDASSGSVDAPCVQLNIAILGNPGSNPSSDFQAWLEARGTTVQRIQTTTDVPLTAEALQPFDVVILDFLTRDYTTSEATIFAGWVSAGGGVVSMSGYQNDPSQDWRANSLLAPLGVAYVNYNGQQVWGPVTDFAAHPITVGLTSITFTGGYAVSDLGGSSSTGTPIAFVPNNAGNIPVAYAVQMDAGHAFVWGDEWIEYDSEWSSMPQMPQLWLQVFSWIAPPRRCTLTGITISAVTPSERSSRGVSRCIFVRPASRFPA
jgi:hypothetical protein